MKETNEYAIISLEIEELEGKIAPCGPIASGASLGMD